MIGGGNFRKAGHAQDFAGDGNQEARAGGNFDFAHGNDEIAGQSQKTWVVGKRLLGFGNADG